MGLGAYYRLGTTIGAATLPGKQIETSPMVAPSGKLEWSLLDYRKMALATATRSDWKDKRYAIVYSTKNWEVHGGEALATLDDAAGEYDRLASDPGDLVYIAFIDREQKDDFIHDEAFYAAPPHETTTTIQVPTPVATPVVVTQMSTAKKVGITLLGIAGLLGLIAKH